MFLLTVALSALPPSASGWAAPTHQRLNTGDPQTPRPPPFTGPLLAPTARTVPQGHVNVEPYLFISNRPGQFNNYWAFIAKPDNISINPQIPIYVGITPWMQAEITPQAFYNVDSGEGSYGFGDLVIKLGFQLYRGDVGDPIPDILLTLAQTFPTGRYDFLDPTKNGSDGTGGGIYATTVLLGLQSEFHVTGIHFLRLRGLLSYSRPNAVEVFEENVYHSRPGSVRPGAGAGGLVSFEFNVSKHWAIASDFDFTSAADTELLPLIGTSEALARSIQQSSYAFSVAPAVEYLLDETWGVVFGPWVTIAGKNTPFLIQGVVALNYSQ